MLEVITGTGLAASAGLNAYIPLLTMGLIARYTDVVGLPSTWQWLENPWVLAILGVLLTVEFAADKIPVVDHVNDALQTVVRPTSGGLVFGASSAAETATVTDPEAFFSGHQWVPIAIGIVVALCIHAMKAVTRAALNALTGGLAAPFLSTAEDATSISMSLAALLFPLLVLVFLAGLIAMFVWARRRRRRRREQRLSAGPGR